MADLNIASEEILKNPSGIMLGGETGRIIESFDWNSSPLGKMQHWPQSLKTSLSIVLNSKFPMFLFWGPDLICFYNDAYRPSLGIDGKHPAIGKKGKDVWPEIWHIIHPIIQQVLENGEAYWNEDQLISIFRNGKVEEVYWTFSYSPVYDESDSRGGILVTCLETTQKVVNLKQLEESKDQLKFAIEATELGTWDYNPVTGKFSGNQWTRQWFGFYEAEEMNIHKAIDRIDEKDKARVVSAIENCLQYSSGGWYDVEYTIAAFQSQPERIVRAKGRAKFNDQKVAYRFNGTIQDITERKTAEVEKQKLVSMVEASHEFIGLADVNGNCQYVNPAGLKMLGWDDCDGKKIQDCVYPEDVQLSEKLLRELFEKGNFSHEIRFMNCKTRQPFWILWNAFTLNDPITNEITGLATVSPNITNRKNAEEVLKATEDKLCSVIAAAPAGIGLLMGRDFKIEVVNKIFIDIIGNGPDIQGQPLRHVLPDTLKEKQQILKTIEEVFDSGKEHQSFASQIDILQDKEVHTHYYNIIYTPLFDHLGKVYAILDIAIDVTEEIHARQKLEESECRFRTMAEESEILIAVSDESSSTTYFSKAWTKLTGRNTQDLLTYGWMDIVHPNDREDFFEIYHHALNNRSRFSGEFRILSKEGNYRWLLANGPPRFRPDGSFAGYISSFIDITERKEAEKSLELKNSQLIQINNDLDNFIYTASHDLKAPMSNIEGLLNSLRDQLLIESRALNQDTEVLLHLMEASVDRFKTTILDLTEITKVQKVEEEDIHEYCFEKIVQDTILSIQNKITESGAVITTDFSEAPYIKFSKKNLKSIIYNLLSNALKYRDKNRIAKISIYTTKANDFTLLSIQDNGLGISKNNQEKMFTMFKRFHDHVEGTGIGLYIVKRIIDNAGGKIEVNSEEGQGTTFCVYFKNNSSVVS